MPTVTITYLVGSQEPFDETIRHLIARNWDATKTNNVTPIFLSPHGSATNAANISTPISNTDIKINQANGLILFEQQNNLHDVRRSSASKNRTGKVGEVLITIYSRSKFEAFLFQEEINRIIAVTLPNTGTWIKKSDNINNSAIASYENHEISFSNPESIDEQSGHVLISTGIIGVQWQKTME